MISEIKFQIRNIELIDLTLKHPRRPVEKETTFSFKINVEQKFIEEQNLVAVTTFIGILEEEDQEPLGSLRTNCIFFVENLNQFLQEDTNSILLPDQFNTTLNSISLSTTRGIMFSQFRGTFLHNMILPIVNPADLKKE